MASFSLLEQTELTGREGLENMFAPIQMPEVEVSPRRATNAACAKASQGGTMPGTIIQVAGITDNVVVVPALPQGATPGLGGNFGGGDRFSHLHILPEEDRPVGILLWSILLWSN